MALTALPVGGAAADCAKDPALSLYTHSASVIQPAIRLGVGGKSVSFSLACYFEGTGLSYEVSLGNSAIAVGTIAVSTDTLTITSGFTPGDATITVKVNAGMANEVIRAFGVTVSSCIMPTEESIPDQTVHASRLSVVIDVSDYFTIAELGYSGATTTYTARTEPAGVVSAGISGSMLTLTKVASSSSATVVVRASVTKSGESSPGCMAEQRFDVRVKTPPRANDQNPVRDTTMVVGDPPIFIHLAPHFIEDDADRLTYYGIPYSEDVVWATITGGQRDSLRIKLVPGLVLTESISDTISVGASDPEDFVYQRLVVQVFPANRAPVVDTPLPDTTQALGGRSIDITLSDHFSDPNGDVLTFTERVSTIATTREADVVTAEIASGALEITPAAAGTATVTVTATDPGGLFVRDDFLVVVTSNRKPVVSSLLRDTTLASGGYTTVLAAVRSLFGPGQGQADVYGQFVGAGYRGRSHFRRDADGDYRRGDRSRYGHDHGQGERSGRAVGLGRFRGERQSQCGAQCR